MILTGHQPNYLPYLGFFEKIASADAFLIVDTVQFVKRGPFGWMHRNRIRTANGWQWLSLPVKTHGKFHQRICDAGLDEHLPWRRKHLRSISMAYARSSHFAHHSDFFEEIYAREWDRLSPLCEELIRYLIASFGIQTEIHKLSDMNVPGKGAEMIVNFCRELGADSYLSGMHGRDYLDPAVFAEAGIRLIFQEYQHPVYRQCQGGDFIPGLSAIDLLFNAGPGSLSILKGGNDPDANPDGRVPQQTATPRDLPPSG